MMYKQRLTAIINATALATALVWLAACGSSAPATTATTAPTAVATAAPAVTAASATTSTTSTETSTVSETTATTSTEAASTEAAAATNTKFNLNTGTPEQFLTIPSMSDRMVREFEEYRPYVSILQFRKEIGKYVDEAQVAAYEEYVYVPVVPNDADTDTLQQLPGVTPEIADQLIAGRPYASNAAFLEALAAQVTPEQLAAAESYLESE